ncbi:MAG: diheme cytochrome c [Thalassolituus sp.]|uniref:diheme cytochrome c n=1 Tax=Thalassolituus sp. TaxID=2030822 RepID=UPI00398202C8
MKPILNTLRYTTGILMLGGALTLGLYGLSSINNLSFADEDDDDHERSNRYSETSEKSYNQEGSYKKERSSKNIESTPTPGTTTADAAAYKAECGSCHIAYPAHFLPARSWHAIMTTLDDHYGDDATVSDTAQANILAYLSAHSASNHSRMMASIRDNVTPMRITKLPYYKRKHSEVPERLVQGNPDVRSFSQCDSCHKNAAKGKFDEDDVVIPGYGRWDD